MHHLPIPLLALLATNSLASVLPCNTPYRCAPSLAAVEVCGAGGWRVQATCGGPTCAVGEEGGPCCYDS